MRRPLRSLVIVGLTAVGLVFGLLVVERLTRDVRSERAIAAHADEVFGAPTSIVAGNPEGDVSVVIFSDYNCPACRRGAADLAAVMSHDRQLRVLVKELPLLGQDSEDTAKAVLAAKRQGKSFALHDGLMRAKGRMTRARALRIARELGLDAARLERDMTDPAIAAALLANAQLAGALGVRGVPFYVIGDKVISGGSGLQESLARGVADVRARGCAVC